ncbi:hypothetical protein [Bacillus benzoevorans]|uniref:Uncharacterized protein n=1 Tax=Bacillus benzoevorans TaxID=1456 RepID=A0A7X0HQW2_9BACI|nr:hypothetical protein [Bacillus benzoevorans]MBB6445249.1 hypothetical protein [Bacillus benzoevorans]
MDYEIETVYYLENPETEQIKFATGSQLRYEDIIKDVFGVASIHDLPMMIQYNKGFQTCLCKSHGIKETEITLEMILRVASKMDLRDFREQYLKEPENEDKSCPFESVIRLQEGIFKWDEEECAYNLIKNK